MKRWLASAAVASALVVPLSCGGESYVGIDLPATLVSSSVRVDDIDAIEVVVSSVALERCDGAGYRAGLSLVPLAFAHTGSSPTVIGVPHVVDLLSETELDLGALAPPPGCWRAARLLLAPGDDDAVGIDDAARVDGATVVISRGGDHVTSTMHHELRAEFGATELRAGDEPRLRLVLTSSLQPDALANLGDDDAVLEVLRSLGAEAELLR